MRERLIAGYERFREFDRSTLRRVETLRGLRVVRYAAWIARRWHDPIFPATWSEFGTDEWWRHETEALEEILRFARGEAVDEREGEESASRGRKDAVSQEPAESELTNKDFFWDWEG